MEPGKLGPTQGHAAVATCRPLRIGAWHEQNRKIIRSKNVVFDEKVLYKDKSSGDLEGTVQGKSEFVSLDILKYTPQDQ